MWVHKTNGVIDSAVHMAPPSDGADAWEQLPDTHPDVLAFLGVGSPGIDDIKRDIYSRINNLRVTVESGGFTWNGYAVQSDPGSRERIIGSALAASLGVRPDGDPWRMANNEDVALTNTEMLAMASALFAHVKHAARVAAAHKDAIAPLISIEQVQAYDYTTGWT
jgi:hypothetical protein